jgi:hypothetical protein
MRYLKRFNESSEDQIILTMDDVRKTKHNLGYGDKPDSFLSNYGWEETQQLVAMPSHNKPETWDGKEVKIFDLYAKGSSERMLGREIGYAISIDGVIEYLISIYEPHGCSLNAKRGCVTSHGHEQIIKLWLDDGEFEETQTR